MCRLKERVGLLVVIVSLPLLQLFSFVYFDYSFAVRFLPHNTRFPTSLVLILLVDRARFLKHKGEPGMLWPLRMSLPPAGAATSESPRGL